MSDQASLFGPEPRPAWQTPGAAVANANGSRTGRVFDEAPESSWEAAGSLSVYNHRVIILRALEARGPQGITSIEAAAILPLTKQGGAQVSNRAATRLGELWELGKVTIRREGGACVLGECHEHRKPYRVHRPTAPCESHGRPLRRQGASIWEAVR